MNAALTKPQYSPGDFGRELRELAEAERALRTQFGDLEINGGPTEILSQSLSTLSIGLQAWKDRFEKTVDELAATISKADFIRVSVSARSCLEIYKEDLAPMLGSIISNQELDWRIRSKSLAFIPALGLEALQIMPLLSKLVTEDPDSRIRVWGCHALGGLGAAAIPALLMAFRSNSSEDVKKGVATSLGMIGLDAVPALQEITRDPSRRVQEAAVKALMEIGKGSLPFLVELLEANPESYLQERIGNAFNKLDPNDLPELIKILRDEHGPLVRLWIARTFEWNASETGAASKDAISTLRELMQRHGDETDFIAWAQKAIDRIADCNSDLPNFFRYLE